MLLPDEIILLLQKNELAEYAQEKKSFLSSIFSKKEWYHAMEMGNRVFTTNMGDYSSQQMSKLLTQLVHEKNSLFNLTDTEYLALKETYRYLFVNRRYLQMAIEKYIQANRLKGLDFKYVRYLLFLSAVQTQQYNRGTNINIVHQFPEEYQLEIALILLMGKIKNGKIREAFHDLDYINRKVLHEGDYSIRYFQSFYKFIFAQSFIGYSEATRRAVEIFEPAKQEVDKVYKEKGWIEFKTFEASEFSFISKVNELDRDALIEFCKLIILNQNHQIHEKLQPKQMTQFLSKIDWTEDSLSNFLNIFLKSFHFIKLPRGIYKHAKALLENGSVKILDLLWVYYPESKKANNEDKTILKLLHEFSHLREEIKTDVATLGQLLSSGFEPVQPSNTQNIYKGMSPEQVRPFFKLVQEVGDVDIVKFYQDREKMKFVRFQIKGEQFDLQTTNGLGIDIMHPLNTLLFENGIPYQFVTFNKSGNPGSYGLNNAPWSNVRVTLINRSSYIQYENIILGPTDIRFAKSDQPTHAFVKRLEELKPIRLKTNLDQIDLKKDPKFRVIREELDKLPNLPAWTKLLTQCLRYPLDAKPSKTWQKLATEYVEQLGKEDFQNGQVMILEKLIVGDEWFQDSEKLCALRGMTWLCQLHPGNGQLYLLQKVSNRAYKKVPGGPLNAKLGNIALETLAAIGNLEAFGIINNVEAKAKYPVYKRAIASRKKKFTKLLKLFSPEELADRSVPSHDLIDGKKTIKIGDVKALLLLDGFKVNITWEMPSGKIQKTVPAHIKTDFAAEIKAVKAEGKSIVETLSSQAKKLEKSWLQLRTWPVENWKEFIMDHGLLRVMTERLIWIMKTEEQSISFMLQEGQPIDNQGNTIGFLENTTIRLWHPSLDSVEETLAWRNRIFDKQIKQPFKQAFREVYILTPAEENTFDHSNRFAGHHLRGNTLYSLGKNREWTMTYEEPPVLKIPGGELVAMLNIRGGVLYSNCDTLDLQFKKIDPTKKTYGYYNIEKIALKEVPPVILSEVMRDVDLFVAVAGLGIDPYFDQTQTGDMMNYWRDASFGKKSQTAMAEVRKDLLKRLLPMTKIAKKCSIDGNYLKVKGSLRDYKINLGSGNILMEPNDQYLCIVPAGDKKIREENLVTI